MELNKSPQQVTKLSGWYLSLAPAGSGDITGTIGITHCEHLRLFKQVSV